MYTQANSATSHGSTTKGFMSLSSQSVLDSSNGPTFAEKIKANLFFLSTNISRYEGFSKHWLTFSAIFRMLQNYAVFLMPGCTVFWKSHLSSSIFITLLTLPIHFCMLPGNVMFHSILMFFLLAIFILIFVVFAIYIVKDTNEHSYRNGDIYLLSFLLGVIVPIFSTFVLSDFGTLLKNYIFFGTHTSLLIAAIACGAVAVCLVIPLHLLAFALVRSSLIINMKSLFSTWGSKILLYAFVDMYMMICSFLEEFLPLNNKWYLFGFSIALLIILNPATILITIYRPTFQDSADGVYFNAHVVVAMVSVVLMNLQFYISSITPTIVFTVILISLALALLLFSALQQHMEGNYLKKLYQVYKLTKSVLPPVTPLIFGDKPATNQVALSQEGYSVYQAFNSLEIKNEYEFLRYLSIGTRTKMIAIADMDFIKWGLSRYHSKEIILICAQVSQYFRDTTQVLSVLLTQLTESDDLGFFEKFVVNELANLHTDLISDKPFLLKNLEKKAGGGLARCRRANALFWGCVLNHSASSMKEALCRIREAINETDSHFDELRRCYPYSFVTIELYLSYLTEVKGYYIECNNYINQMSAHFIEQKSNAMIMDETSVDGISVLLKDPSKSFSMYTESLTSYMEQERHANMTTHAPMISMWTLTIVSLLAMMICGFFVIITTLITFNTYPQLLQIVRDCSDVIIQMASMSLAARRLCLFAKDELKEPNLPFGNLTTDASNYDSVEKLLPWFIEGTENMSVLLMKFYKSAAFSSEVLNTIEHVRANFVLFEQPFEGSLSFALDLMTNSLKNIAGNVPSLFENHVFPPSNKKSANEETSANISMFSKGFHNFKNTLRINSDNSTIFLIKNNSSELLKMTYHDYAINPKEFEDYKAYAVTCQSPCIKHNILNIEPLVTLLEIFFERFLELAKARVDSLSDTLFYSKLTLPAAFVVVFGIALAVVVVFSFRESDFRTTLYLSLPEQVASDIFRAGGISRKRRLRNDDGGNNQKPQPTKAETIIANETNAVKEKALNIESLYQFTQTERNTIQGTGINHFIGWSIFYILLAALFMLLLTMYSSTINDGFFGRSVMLCDSAMRFMKIMYATLFTSEYFYPTNGIELITNRSQIYELSTKFLNSTIELHNVLTYGGDKVQYDFREYEGIKKLITTELGVNMANVTELPYRSMSTLQHDSYKQLGFDTRMRIYTDFLRGVIENFKENSDAFKLNDETWQQFHHLFFGHLLSMTSETTPIYHHGVSDVIQMSFITALMISLVAIILLVLIFLFPLRQSLKALGGYFDLTLHAICMIPPEVFSRSMYIGKWLKGQISMMNYTQFETNFKRTVSPQLQSNIVSESPEEIIMFRITGEFFPSAVCDGQKFGSDPSLESIIEKISDTNQDPLVIDHVKHGMERFMEAKDVIDNINIKTISIEGNPMKLTMRGIPTAESDLNDSSMSIQKYYAYVAIIKRDITKESNDLNSLKIQREKTLALLKQVVPESFAKRLQDGETRISFSAGIGTVMNVRIINYENIIDSMNPEIVGDLLVGINNMIVELLKQFSNVSLMSNVEGAMIFVAGLFNDEQNGRTEALDTIQFAFAFHSEIKKIFDEFEIDTGIQYGISTGGPIYCKLLMETTPVSLISDDTAGMSAQIVKMAKSGQALLERTTYECIYGMNIDASIVGDFEFNGKHTSLYSINIALRSRSSTSASISGSISNSIMVPEHEIHL